LLPRLPSRQRAAVLVFTIEIFKGVIMAFRLDKPFPGVLVATKNVGGVTKFLRDLFGRGRAGAESGDAEMDKSNEFRSDNPDAARQLMRAGFLEALDRLREAWPRGARPRSAIGRQRLCAFADAPQLLRAAEDLDRLRVQAASSLW
jgi:hypothetical protein